MTQTVFYIPWSKGGECDSAFQNIRKCVDCCMKLERSILMTPNTSHHHPAHRTQVASRVWPQPGKEPLVDVDRAVLVAIHHRAAVLTAICPDPQRHVFLVFADMARPGPIAFVYDMQFFP